jgi:hypothetical protein
VHKTRAEIDIAQADRLVHPVVHDDVSQDPRQQQQTQTQDQSQERFMACVHEKDARHKLWTADPFDPRPIGPLAEKLRKIGVTVSPLIVYTDGVVLEKAFVVAGSDIGLCALVELWAWKTKRTFTAYTRRGALVRGAAALPGHVLFGMYLCGATLPHAMQRELLRYLLKRYVPRDRDNVLAVIRCLTSARILPMHTGWLRQLAESTQWDADTTPPDLLFVAATSAFGTRRYV